jgi:serine phosphatase RsbU (regulator of sigma subunit)
MMSWWAYTDGVTDSPDIEGNSFEQKRLERVLLDCRFRDPNKILRVILNELSSHSAGCSQVDDITPTRRQTLLREVGFYSFAG